VSNKNTRNKRIPVFLASDDGYAMLAAVMMRSVVANTKSPVDFYFIDTGISADKRARIESMDLGAGNKLEFIHMDIAEKFSDFKTWENVSITGFARLLIPWLRPELDRVVYLDCDVIATGDVADFYGEDLEGNPLGAMEALEMNCLPGYIDRARCGVDLSPEHVYFNSGILLIDCAMWRADKTLPERFFEIEKQYPDKFCGDQDLLNKAFEHNYKQLPQKYNVTTCARTCYDSDENHWNAMKHMVFRHFVGGFDKPYNIGFNGSTKDFRSHHKFWEYAFQTPFYPDFMANFILNVQKPLLLGAMRKKRIVYLFGVIPIGLIKIGNIGTSQFRLFGILPIWQTRNVKCDGDLIWEK